MIALYHAAGSAHSASVRMVLAEKGLEYRSRPINLARFEQAGPDFLQINPAGQVPVLEEDGRRLTEAFFITLYLDERYPDPPLGGANAQARYNVQKWGKYVETHIAPHLAIVRWAEKARALDKSGRARFASLPPERRALWARAAEGFGEEQVARSREALAIAARRLASDVSRQEWLAGAKFTLADIAAYPHVQQLPHLGIALENPVSDWLARVEGRPAARAEWPGRHVAATMGPEAGRWG